MATLDHAGGFLDYKHHLTGDALALSAFARAEGGVTGIRSGSPDPFVAAMAGLRLEW